MAVDAVKIPQNVQIEDKVVGPLSLRQIIILALGGGFSYMIYSMVQRSIGYVNIPLTVMIWIPAAIAAAFAVVNINDLSLLRICFLLLEKTQKPGTRIWAPRPGISITIRSSAFKMEDPARKTRTAPAQNTLDQITALSSAVDRSVSDDSIALADESVGTLREAPVATPNTAATSATPKRPVNPASIQVDVPPTNDLTSIPSSGPAAKKDLSDLAVFRDVFPPTQQWPQ